MDNDEKLDTSWIDEFEKDDKYYSHFYKEDVSSIKIQSIYVNNSNEIQNMKQDKYKMSVLNELTRDELFNLLLNKSYHNNKRYTLLSILKYNIDIEPVHVKSFLRAGAGAGAVTDSNFLTKHTNIDTISFKKTIRMFNDLNSIIFVFIEKNKMYNGLNGSRGIGSSNKQTKRVVFQPRKKTYKKMT
jgi:hypothetical protein